MHRNTAIKKWSRDKCTWEIDKKLFVFPYFVKKQTLLICQTYQMQSQSDPILKWNKYENFRANHPGEPTHKLFVDFRNYFFLLCRLIKLQTCITRQFVTKTFLIIYRSKICLHFDKIYYFV